MDGTYPCVCFHEAINSLSRSLHGGEWPPGHGIPSLPLPLCVDATHCWLAPGCCACIATRLSHPWLGQITKPEKPTPVYHYITELHPGSAPPPHFQQARQPAAGIAARRWLGKGDALQIVLSYMVLLLEIKILFGDSTITIFFLKTDLNWEDHKSWEVDLLMHFKKASI